MAEDAPVADASAMGDIFKNSGEFLYASESQPIVPQTPFIGLHGPGNGIGSGNGVHAQFIQLIVPVQNLLQIIVADIAA